MNRHAPKRYQLSQNSVRVVRSSHPWIFRNALSSAVDAFQDGQWLELVDGNNQVVGYGTFQKEGMIGIRVFGKALWPPTPSNLKNAVQVALKKREDLRKFSNSFRAIHGENDGFPGVVIDIYGSTAILQSYHPSCDLLTRYVAEILSQELKIRNLLWKVPTRMRVKEKETGIRILRGKVPGIIEVKEGKLKYSVDLSQAQKSGSYLDLRGLRKWVILQKWNGFRVLNLFSYTGTLGLSAEMAGAKEICHVDVSKGALDFGKKYHGVKSGRWIETDILKTLKIPDGKFDVIVVDPPSMASQISQVSRALALYKKLYQRVAEHLTPKGVVIGACCTSRIPRKDFERVLDGVFRGKKRQTLWPESDHPVSFTEGDYLKILVYR